MLTKCDIRRDTPRCKEGMWELYSLARIAVSHSSFTWREVYGFRG